MKEAQVHRGSAAQIQTMFLGNDPERERAFIPLMSNEVDLPEPNKIKRIIFKTTKWGWFCFIWMAPRRAQSCKELIQTDLHYSPAEREQKTTKPRKKKKKRGEPPPLPPSFFLHSTGEYEHMISHMLHHPPPPPPPHTHTHTHGCESAQKHCGVHPGPSQPNFPATPIQAPCPHRLSYKTPPTLRPTQSPLQSLKPPPRVLQPRPVNSGLCPERSTGRQPRPRWMNGAETQELWEKEAEKAHINRMVSNWFVPPEQRHEHAIHINSNQLSSITYAGRSSAAGGGTCRY